jgi:hypothetical protein
LAKEDADFFRDEPRSRDRVRQKRSDHLADKRRKRGDVGVRVDVFYVYRPVALIPAFGVSNAKLNRQAASNAVPIAHNIRLPVDKNKADFSLHGIF